MKNYKRFFIEMKKKNKMLFTFANINIPLRKYEKEYEQFNIATEFRLCNQPLSLSKVEDHLPGNSKGATHNTRCINAKQPKFVQLVFHNLSWYDSRMFF